MKLPSLTSTSTILTFAVLCGLGAFVATLLARSPDYRGSGGGSGRGFLQVMDPLPDTIPDLEQMVLSGRRVGAAWFKLGRLYREDGREEAAADAWRHAAPMRLEVAGRQRQPDNPDPWYEAGWAYSQIGDKESARQPLIRAEELLTKQARDFNDRQVWYKLGWARKLLGGEVDAQIAWARALDQLNSQTTLGPGEMYDVACYSALLGETEKAFDALDQAIRMGFRNAAHAEHDEDFEGIRGDPRFAQAILHMKQAEMGVRIESGP